MVDFGLKGPSYKGGPRVSNVPALNGPRYKTPEPAPEEPSWMDQAGGFAMDTLRNFNDTLTFGLYDDALAASGIDPEARAKTEAANQNTGANIVGDTLGYMLPGAGMSSLVAKGLPRLAGNTLGQIAGREAISNGLLSATDDVVRTGSIDPMGVGIDTAVGGILSPVVAGVGRAISPGARVRASGGDLTPADTEMAYNFSKSAEANGIPLTNPEAIGAVAPSRSASSIARYNAAADTPKGSQEAYSFDQGRTPKVEDAGRNLAAMVGPGIPPQDAARLAAASIDDVGGGFSLTAKPYYDAAAPITLSSVPKSPMITTASQSLRQSRPKMDDLRDQLGAAVVPPNSVAFLDGVKKNLDTAYNTADKDAWLQSIIAGDAYTLTNAMDAAAPTYSTARDIAGQGARAVEDLQTGPLGRIANNPGNSAAQGSALFGPTTRPEAVDAREAALMLGNEPARGILANNVDSAVSNNGLGWGRAALPNEFSRDLAEETMGANYAQMADTIKAAQAVSPAGAPNARVNNNGPISAAIESLRGLGEGDVVRLMQDPEWIRKVGVMGPVQKGFTLTSVGAGKTAAENQRRKRNRGEL